ncbi:anthranilate phosphoribosyltransferase [Arachidicoccus rhizosphaerae]|uniref:Anthranilate phosphoribosyltransferase n=1 Tax=Arachidicoccus rhizosphaerae TaxID=551991 RepID=A0A1H3WNC0_9BACT|nr:anthranilate phosphoribosyltransferase [Arachidicoccus rhizosphaerae]SDZ88271.1 anthranilate phosphoribosyltransferase [Arachidicoccus rhizosphaerae]
MKKILQYLFDYKTLSTEAAKDILIQISKGMYTETEITAFVTVFLMRTITIDELKGFSDALLELCVKVDLGPDPLMDIVGTGGDGKNTFNISTLACFITAGAGQKVAKHGNYGATSISGSSNVMEQLGYVFKADQDKLQKELQQAGICFLHAPSFHPALKTVGPLRKNLGVRTFFNMLGPLVNPARPKYQLLGVYNLEMARLYNYLLQQSDRDFAIVHSMEGYDEISLTGDSKIITRAGEKVASAEALGKRQVSASDIFGGNTLQEAADLFRKIIHGNGSWAQNAVVLANAATALHCTGNYPSYQDAYQSAVDSLESGKALAALEKLIKINQDYQ